MQRMRPFGVIWLAAALVSCGDPGPVSEETLPAASADPVETTAPEISDAAREEAIKAVSKIFPQQLIPKGVGAPPVAALYCPSIGCVTARVQFERNDWPKAWQGDYQGQRNVAYCRSTGCDTAVMINKAEACAWRTIIIQTHPDETEDTDTQSFKLDCGRLDGAAIASAIEKANSIYRRITGKIRPPGLLD